VLCSQSVFHFPARGAGFLRGQISCLQSAVLLPSDRSRLRVLPRLVAANFCYQIQSPPPLCPAGFNFHWSGLFSFMPAEFLRPVSVHRTGSCRELLPSARQSFHKSGSRVLCCSSTQGLLGLCDLGFAISFECEALQVEFQVCY
jgi:hypothetical protein